jgi:phosphatidyl-myo-inositol dimannoside synthase
MRIAFYAPLKPLGHPNPSGDLVIATGLSEYLAKEGHRLKVASSLRARWIYWKPWQWPHLLRERRQAIRGFNRDHADIWMTYHTYYKAPDLLGPTVCRHTGLPYVIFQGIYSTKRRRSLSTLPGFILNRRALENARHVFTNRREDYINLNRLLPESRLSYVAPGIRPKDFRFNPDARKRLRQSWNIGNEPVILSAAMFRPGVKAEGLTWVIRACGKLHRQGARFHLVIAGEGKEKKRIAALAQEHLPGKVRFTGKIQRNEMYGFYSAGDLFVFPGIRESLGMVYLEAQSCGLPVVAFANGGIPEVVSNGETGILVPLFSFERFVGAIDRLMGDKELRRRMGRSAGFYVRKNHDLAQNYRKVETVLESVINNRREKNPGPK